MAEKRNKSRKKQTRPLIKSIVIGLLLVLFLAVELLGGGTGWDTLEVVLGGPSAGSIPAHPADSAVHFIDVGQGDSVLLESGGEYALIDTGTSSAWESLQRYLDDQGVSRLKYLFISHIHADHMGGAAKLLNALPVEKVLLPDLDKGPEPTTVSYEKMLLAIDEKNIPAEMASVGTAYPLGSGMVTILGSGVESEDQNDTSTALRFDAGDLHFLATGDGEAAVEKDLLARGSNLQADLFKAGHHGSSTSNSLEFLTAVRPSLVVASCGLNNDYGHPHQETIDNCRAVGAELLRTDLDGSVVVWAENGALQVLTEKER